MIVVVEPVPTEEIFASTSPRKVTLDAAVVVPPPVLKSEVDPVVRAVREDVTAELKTWISTVPVPAPGAFAFATVPALISLPPDSTIALPATSAAPAMSKPSWLPAPIAIVIAVFLGTATA